MTVQQVTQDQTALMSVIHVLFMSHVLMEIVAPVIPLSIAVNALQAIWDRTVVATEMIA